MSDFLPILAMSVTAWAFVVLWIDMRSDSLPTDKSFTGYVPRYPVPKPRAKSELAERLRRLEEGAKQ